jgi:hypothetical protein
MKTTLKIGLLACVLAVMATGCSIDHSTYANGSHLSFTPLWPGEPSIRNDGTLVPNQPASTQVVYVRQPDGTFVPVSGGQSSGSSLPPSPVFGINSDSGSKYHWEYNSGADCQSGYPMEGNCTTYTQGSVTSNGGVNHSYNGCPTPNQNGGRRCH